MNAVTAPKPKIDLRERLVFFYRRDNDNDKATNILWPGVFYHNLAEYSAHLQDEMSLSDKSKITLELLSAYKSRGREVNILRPLGNKSVVNYIKSVDGLNEYYDYTSSICLSLISHIANPNAFASDKEYLEYMDGLDESEVIFRGPENPSNESTWREYGQKTLRERASGSRCGMVESVNNEATMMQVNTGQNNATDKEIRAIILQETATPQNSPHAPSKAPTAVATKPAASRDITMTGESRPVSDELETDSYSTEMAEDASCAVSEDRLSTQTTNANCMGTTPLRQNYLHSSATVVSTDTYDDYVTEASGSQTPSRQDPWPFQQPNLKESMDAEAIAFALTMVGFQTMKVNKKTFHTFPGVTNKSFKEGENAILFENLVDFAKKNNYFQNVGRELFSPSSEAKSTEKPNSPRKMTSGQGRPPLSPMRTPRPKRGNKKQTEPTSKKHTEAANRKQAKSKTGANTKQARVTRKATPSPKYQSGSRRQHDTTTIARCSPRRASNATSAKKKQLSADPFYEFNCLINVLQNNFDWKYRAGGLESNWLYIRGDSKLGRKGKRGDDFFGEEWEVIEYCLEHKYKEKFQLLTEEEEDEKGRSERKSVVEDSMFKTPPPTRRVLGAMQ
ncbi:MAG: hypothetical protein SGBAC_007899 [Bacillariaceae sp.]